MISHSGVVDFKRLNARQIAEYDALKRVSIRCPGCGASIAVKIVCAAPMLGEWRCEKCDRLWINGRTAFYEIVHGLDASPSGDPVHSNKRGKLR